MNSDVLLGESPADRHEPAVSAVGSEREHPGNCGLVLGVQLVELLNHCLSSRSSNPSRAGRAPCPRMTGWTMRSGYKKWHLVGKFYNDKLVPINYLICKQPIAKKN